MSSWLASETLAQDGSFRRVLLPGVGRVKNSPLKARLYLETTVPSYLTAWPSRDLIRAGHQQITREWWESRRADFEVFISQLVLDEASAGDPAAARERLAALKDLPQLDITDDVVVLARRWWRRWPSRRGHRPTRRTSPSPRFTECTFC